MTTSGTGNSGKGLTFIEILIVIILMGVMTGISVPYFKRAFSGLRFYSFTRELQLFMNYLQQRSVTEGVVTILTVDNENKEYWAKDKDATGGLENNGLASSSQSHRFKTYSVPLGINIESSLKEIFFYPDGNIDKVTIKLVNSDNQAVSLTTQGVFGGVKLLSQK